MSQLYSLSPESTMETQFSKNPSKTGAHIQTCAPAVAMILLSATVLNAAHAQRFAHRQVMNI